MREGILAQECLTLIKYIIMDVLLPNVNMPLTVKANIENRKVH